MKKEKLLESWVALGDARPRFDEYERAMRRPLRINRYGFVDAVDLLAWLFREEDGYAYHKLRHALCSRHIAQAKAAERRAKLHAGGAVLRLRGGARREARRRYSADKASRPAKRRESAGSDGAGSGSVVGNGEREGLGVRS